MREIDLRGSGEVTLPLGEVFTVCLEENATTGYHWSPGQIPDVIVQVDDRFVSPSAARSGAGGERILRFRAERPGIGNLVLLHARGWESVPRTTVKIRVEVSG
jgi:inhibitor of cysteine peptidase